MRARAFGSIALAAAALAGSAGPAAAHGGDTTKVHGCIMAASAGVKIVDAGGSCAKNELALDWPAVDTDTTYGAGSGLSLTGNVFSVTGAPWSGLTGVPAGFADGIDDVGGTVDYKSDDATAPREPNDGDGFVHWNNLESVPAGLLDGDDDGSAKVGGLKADLAQDDGSPNETGDLVSFSKIKDLVSGTGANEDGRITGRFIGDGSITARDLAGSYAGGNEVVVGAVTSEKIADGSIEARDLAADLITRTLTTISVDPQAAPAESRIAVTVPWPSSYVPLTTSDLVTVSPPGDLNDDLLFVGSDVLTDGTLTIYLYNDNPYTVDDVHSTWQVRQLKIGG